MYDAQIEQISLSVKTDGIVDRFVDMDFASRISQKADDVLRNTRGADLLSIEEVLENYRKVKRESDVSYLVDINVESLIEEILVGDGVTWRLDELNRSVGQVHQTDFVMIGKRPETGGTSFLLSEFTYMLHQLPKEKNIVIFNNEEGGKKIAERLIQTALNVSSKDMLTDPKGIAEAYKKFLGTKRIDIYDKEDLSMSDIDKFLSKGEYGLIGINILEKIKGVSNKYEGVEQYRRLARWARGVANRHGAVFGIAQADYSAEGIKYMNQSQLYGSKTTVQQETDVLIMIGATHEPTERHKRYFSICRNKKPLTGVMDTKCKHLKFTAKFDHERGRMTSYKGGTR